MPADLFISYARKDREQVVPWVQRLQEAGVSLWLDETDIDGAHHWPQAIVEAIHACRVLVLMASPASVASEHVIREVTLALEQKKRILPLMLEPTEIPTVLQYPLAGLQQIDLSRGDRNEKHRAILRTLTRLGVGVPGWDEPAGAAGPGIAPGPMPSPRELPPNNLPRQLTRFIGREKQMEEIKPLLRSNALLTLMGAGGSGKTRLAIQVASELLEEFPDGVWLVELAFLTDPALVPQTVAAALGILEEPGRPLQATLTEALRPKRVLSVLDNCEHLISACAGLAYTLLGACPDLRLLATSREVLGVPGEVTRRVPSLSFPNPRRLPPLEQLTQYEAVRLFVDRALLTQPTFAVTEANARAVAQVCHRLDGIPLALELAAARVKVLPVEKIAERLDDRFRLLTGGSRVLLPRQQTLRALIDWSYDLLSETERVLWGQLSVFAGGFTVEAAEAICAGDPIEKWEVLDLLTQLVEKSLVVVEEPEGIDEVGGSTLGYRLTETIRQYGREKLEASGEASAVRARHRDWYLALAEEAENALRGAEQGQWLDRLEAEHDNLRAAVRTSVESAEATEALRLGAALWRFWFVRGHLAEGRERLTELLALPGAEARTALRGKTLSVAGVLARAQGEYAAARAFWEEALAIGRELGNKPGIISTLGNLGVVALDQADYPAARALFEESLALWRELGDTHGIARSLSNLGLVAEHQGNATAARALHEESLALWRQLGEKHGIANSLSNLGNVRLDQGDTAAARALHEESLALRQELGDRPGIASSLTNLGEVALDEGDLERARAFHEESLAQQRELGNASEVANSLANLGKVARRQGNDVVARSFYEQSLVIRRELDDKGGIAECLAGLAAVHAQTQPERSARLLGAVEALREALGAPLSAREQTDLDEQLAAVRAALGEDSVAAAQAAGRAMPLEQAIAQAVAPSHTALG